jgi:hypothetical protein
MTAVGEINEVSDWPSPLTDSPKGIDDHRFH